MKTNIVFLFLTLSMPLVFCPSAIARSEVTEAVLCLGINERNPAGRINDAGDFTHAEHVQQSIPSLSLKHVRKVYYWNSISSDDHSECGHIWIHNGSPFSDTETSIPLADQIAKAINDFAENIRISIQSAVTGVSLKYKPSPRYRTWSSKEIVPALAGDWEVRTVSMDEKGKVLASVKFRIDP